MFNLLIMQKSSPYGNTKPEIAHSLLDVQTLIHLFSGFHSQKSTAKSEPGKIRTRFSTAKSGPGSVLRFPVLEFPEDFGVIGIADAADPAVCNCFFHRAVGFCHMIAALEPAVRLERSKFRIVVLQVLRRDIEKVERSKPGRVNQEGIIRIRQRQKFHDAGRVAAALNLLRELACFAARVRAQPVDERGLPGAGRSRDDRCFP